MSSRASDSQLDQSGLTDRQTGELEFYEEFSRREPAPEVNLDPIMGLERRPWNSYWRVIEIVKDHYKSPEQRVLDYGCGRGESAVLLSKIGYEVYGFDLSPNNVAIANELAKKHEVSNRTNFRVGTAENLKYPAEFFDGIVGTDILHHVNIEQAMAECARVLKQGGLAIFHEPLRAPVFDRLRETKLGTWVVPKEASLDRHITHDERKLDKRDLEVIRRLDPQCSTERFLLLSRLDRFVRDPGRNKPSLLERLDYKLFAIAPFLKRFGGIVVITLRKR